MLRVTSAMRPSSLASPPRGRPAVWRRPPRAGWPARCPTRSHAQPSLLMMLRRLEALGEVLAAIDRMVKSLRCMLGSTLLAILSFAREASLRSLYESAGRQCFWQGGNRALEFSRDCTGQRRRACVPWDSGAAGTHHSARAAHRGRRPASSYRPRQANRIAATPETAGRGCSAASPSRVRGGTDAHQRAYGQC
jgi:hypothetical protein